MHLFINIYFSLNRSIFNLYVFEWQRERKSFFKVGSFVDASGTCVCEHGKERESERWSITWSPSPQRSGLIDLLFSPTLLWEKGKRAKQQPIRSCRGSWQRILQWHTILTKGGPVPALCKNTGSLPKQKASFRGEPREREARASNEEACRLHCAGCSFSPFPFES